MLIIVFNYIIFCNPNHNFLALVCRGDWGGAFYYDDPRASADGGARRNSEK